MKKLTILLLLLFLLLAIASCSGGEAQEETSATDKEEQVDGTLKMRINDTDVSVEWEENESVEALRRLAKDGPSRQGGYAYFTENRVTSAKQIGPACYSGTVRGSGEAENAVTIDLEHLRKSSCDCPFAAGRSRIYKHMVALPDRQYDYILGELTDEDED